MWKKNTQVRRTRLWAQQWKGEAEGGLFSAAGLALAVIPCCFHSGCWLPGPEVLLEPSFCQLSPAPLITLTHLSFSGGLPIALQRTGGLPAHCASPWSSGQEQKPQPTPACLPACLQQFFPIFFRTSLAAAAFSSFFLSPCPSHSSWELAGNQQ